MCLHMLLCMCVCISVCTNTDTRVHVGEHVQLCQGNLYMPEGAVGYLPQSLSTFYVEWSLCLNSDLMDLNSPFSPLAGEITVSAS